jgi:hypothetical protein
MATIRIVTGEALDVPDEALTVTERGIEWVDEGRDGFHHTIPWSAVVELIRPDLGPPKVVSPTRPLPGS